MKICIIGDSFVGAVYSAYISTSTKLDIDFFTAAGANFRDIKYENGLLKYFCHSNLKGKNEVNLNQYSHIFLYADFPDPAILARKLMGGYFSNSLTKTYIKEQIKNSNVYILANAISITRAAKDICFIPVNVDCRFQGVSIDRNLRIVNTMREIIEYEIGFFKGPIFDDNFIPKSDYHKDSVYVDGQTRGKDIHPHHDDRHMNKAGGEVILRSIENYLRV